MTYSEMITEIITRADESFIGVAEERARTLFKGVVTDLLIAGDYKEEDVFGFLDMASITLSAAQSIKIAYQELDTNASVLRVNDIFPDPESADGYIITEKGINDIRRYSGTTGLIATGKNVYFFRYGKYIRFLPASELNGKTVLFSFVKEPPEYYDITTGPYEWIPSTVMTTFMSYAFLTKAIAITADSLEKEINKG